MLLIPSVSAFSLLRSDYYKLNIGMSIGTDKLSKVEPPEQARGLINGFADPQLYKVRCFFVWSIQIATKTERERCF